MQSSVVLVSPRRGVDERAMQEEVREAVETTCEFCNLRDCSSLTGATPECPTLFDWDPSYDYWLDHLDDQVRMQEEVDRAWDEFHGMSGWDDPWDYMDHWGDPYDFDDSFAY